MLVRPGKRTTYMVVRRPAGSKNTSVALQYEIKVCWVHDAAINNASRGTIITVVDFRNRRSTEQPLLNLSAGRQPSTRNLLVVMSSSNDDNGDFWVYPQFSTCFCMECCILSNKVLSFKLTLDRLELRTTERTFIVCQDLLKLSFRHTIYQQKCHLGFSKLKP